jgi:PST family polysaccharide transporter
MKDLKKKVVQSGVAKLVAQVANSALRLGYTAVMARLLHPEDFGLLAMVVAITGIYDLFTTAGLLLAAVQKQDITEDQISTLFWVNVLVGAILFLLCLGTAPVLVSFYGEPRLFWITTIMGAGFLFNAAGAQASALLQRQLRYVELSAIETLSLLLACTLGVGLALWGFGYWGLVSTAIATPAIAATLMWTRAAWLPGLPRRDAGIRSLLGFGGTVTLNNLIVYFGYTLDKLLIGRVWGPGALGVYGTSYNLAYAPTLGATGAIGAVAFAALARLQDDPARLRSYFLRGFSLLISISTPITLFTASFADDIVSIMLGPRWADAAALLRLFAPTILVLSVINPIGWLLQSIGLQGRSLRIALVLTPLMICGYLIGLPYGPKGVALGFSAAMTLWLLPHVFWSLHGTGISPREFFLAAFPPFFAGTSAAALSFGVAYLCLNDVSSIVRLVPAGIVMGGTYFAILMFGMKQKAFYWSLLRDLGGFRSASSSHPAEGAAG